MIANAIGGHYIPKEMEKIFNYWKNISCLSLRHMRLRLTGFFSFCSLLFSIRLCYNKTKVRDKETVTMKIYLQVNADFDLNGNIRPRSITWENGRVCEWSRNEVYMQNPGKGGKSVQWREAMVDGNENAGLNWLSSKNNL